MSSQVSSSTEAKKRKYYGDSDDSDEEAYKRELMKHGGMGNLITKISSVPERRSRYMSLHVKDEDKKLYTVGNEIICNACNITVNGPQALKSHINGQKHAKNLQTCRRVGRIGDLDFDDRNIISYPAKKIRVNMPTLQSLLSAYSDEPAIGLHCIKEHRPRSANMPPIYKCMLCGSHANVDSMYNHVLGFPHRVECFKVLFGEEEDYNSLSNRQAKAKALEVEEIYGRFVDMIEVVVSDSQYPWPTGTNPALRDASSRSHYVKPVVAKVDPRMRDLSSWPDPIQQVDLTDDVEITSSGEPIGESDINGKTEETIIDELADIELPAIPGEEEKPCTSVKTEASGSCIGSLKELQQIVKNATVDNDASVSMAFQICSGLFGEFLRYRLRTHPEVVGPKYDAALEFMDMWAEINKNTSTKREKFESQC